MSGNSLTLVLLKTQIKNIWQMAKVNIKSEKITPFGGIYYASKAFYALSLDKVINGTAGITWYPDTDEPHNRACHKGTLPWRHGIQVFVRQCVQIQYQPKTQWPSDETSVFTSLSPTSRVKKFVFHFTAVCAKWTRTARRWWLNLYTGMPYDKLSFG